MAKKKKSSKGKSKSKGMFGAIGSVLGSLPAVGKVKNAAKAVKKKVKAQKKKLKKAVKKAKRKLKKKIGKVYTKARKIKNNLSKSKLVKKVKRAAKKAVLATKKVAKKAKSVAKAATKALKKVAKKAVVLTKSMSIAQVASIAIDFIPVVGNAKAAFETAFGFDPIAMKKLSKVDRAISAAGIVGGGAAKLTLKGIKAGVKLVSTGKKTTKVTESVVNKSQLLKNLAESKKARESSKFGVYSKKEKEALNNTKGTGNNGSTIKNKFPDEELPKDGKILSYSLKDGKIKGIDGRTEVDFVIDKNGNLVIGKRHHTLGNKDEVLAAGQLKINGQGEVRRITNESGHYRPTPKEAMDYPQLIKDAGVNVKGAWIEFYSYKIDADGFIIDSTKVVSKKLTE
ncbi:MAG: pre-toxin TG domain-containing protein [Lysinibacillus sp.]